MEPMSRYLEKPTEEQLLEADLEELRKIFGQAVQIKAINVRKQHMREFEKMRRTSQQNKALHKGCRNLADALSDAGLDAKKTLKPEIEIPWTADLVKDLLYRPILEAMYPGKTSTAELETDEVSKVWEVLNRHLAEKFGVQVPFPGDDE